MAIEIKLEKIWDRQHGLMYEVEDIRGAMEEEGLPDEYLRGFPRAFIEPCPELGPEPRRKLLIRYNCTSAYRLYIGYQYTKEEMEARLAALRECGNRLHEIRARQKREAKGWQGEETYII